MLVDIGYSGLESLHDHLAVLLAYDLVTDPAGGVDLLLPDRLDFGQDLPVLGCQDSLEDSGGLVDQVRHGLVEGALRRHVDGLRDQLLRVPTTDSAVDPLDEE